jgi:hypothetical protein
MTRILLDPAELSGAATELRGAAGEYQAIGARVASCDCGCMPPAVAATVDAAAHSIRSRLDGLAAGLAQEGSGLGWRAGVPQDGALATTAVSSAYGGGDQFVVGGTALAGLSAASGGMTLVIGGSDMGAVSDYNPFASVLGPSGELVIGGGGYPGGTGGIGGAITVGGYNPFASVMGSGGELIIGGDGYPGGPGGIGGAISVGGYNPFASVIGPSGELVIGGSDGVDYDGYSRATYEMNRAMDRMLADTFYTNPSAYSILMGSRLSSQRTILGLALPSGWRLEPRPWP